MLLITHYLSPLLSEVVFYFSTAQNAHTQNLYKICAKKICSSGGGGALFAYHELNFDTLIVRKDFQRGFSFCQKNVNFFERRQPAINLEEEVLFHLVVGAPEHFLKPKEVLI